MLKTASETKTVSTESPSESPTILLSAPPPHSPSKGPNAETQVPSEVCSVMFEMMS